MSGNPNSDVKTSTTIDEGSSPQLFSTFQDGDKREEISKAISKSQDKEKSGETVDSSQDICTVLETEEVCIFQDLAIKGPKVVDAYIDTENLVETEEVSIFQNIKKKESKTVDTSEDIEKKVETEGNSTCQGRGKIGETEVFSTSQDLDSKEPKVVDSSQDMKKFVKTEEVSTFEYSKEKEPKAVGTSEDIKNKVETTEVNTCQNWEKIEETEVLVSTSQALENKGEPEAICSSHGIEKITEAMLPLEASEDSISEGSIHILVSEPFSLSEDLELYLSEGNSDDGTENVVDCLSEPPLLDQNGIWAKQEVINGEVNPIIPQASGQGTPVAETKNPDKSEKMFLTTKPSSLIFTNMEYKDKSPRNPDQVADTEKHLYTNQPKRRGRPPKSVIKNYQAGSDDSANKNVKQRSLKQIEQGININVGEIAKTEIMSIDSIDKTVLDERKRKENLAAEEPTSSPGHAFKRNTVNILTPKDLINKTLAKLMSGNVPRSQKKSLGEREKEVISDPLKVSSKGKSEKIDISEKSISNESNINMSSRPRRGFKSIKGLEQLSTKCHTTQIKDLPARELLTKKGSKNKNNSEQTNTCISLNSSLNEDCKIQPNLGKSSNKSHSVTMITQRELINRTLEKLTCKQIPQAKQKTSVEVENSKGNNLSSEQLIEKRKKEEMQRELINSTLAKLTNGSLPKSKQEKADEEITNDSSGGPCITKSEEEKVAKKKPATLRALIPRESKSRAKIFIPLKLMENSKGRATSSSSSECNKQESQKSISSHNDNFETKNQMALLQNESYQKNIPGIEPSNNICSTLKIGTLTDPNLNNKKTIRPKTTLEVKDDFFSISDVVSPDEKNNEKVSQKTSVKREKLCIENQDQMLFESPVLHNVKCNQLSEKNKSCPTLNGLTQEPEVTGKHPKSKQLNSKEEVFRKKSQFASNIRRKKQLQKTVLSKKYKLTSKKELVMPLKQKFKRKVQIDRQKSLSFKMAVANKQSISMTGKKSKTSEIISEDRHQKCSSSSQIPSTDQVKYREQIKANPRVCLVDCKKIGLCASNEDVSKFKFQAKNDPTLKQVTCIPNHSDNHMIADSGEYFTQLELSPASKSPRLSNLPLKSLPTSPNKKKSTVDKGSQINEIVIIDDDDDDDYYLSDLCSISALLPAHKREGSKQCSVGSSQKSVSIENFATKKSPGDHTPNKINCNSVPGEQSSSVKMIKRAFSLSTQVQNDSINYASHFQSSSVIQLQSVVETHNYRTQSSVRKDNNLISTKLKDGTRDLLQSKRSVTSPLSSNIVKYSSINIAEESTPHNTIVKKGTPPLTPAEIRPTPLNTLVKKGTPSLMPAEIGPTPHNTLVKKGTPSLMPAEIGPTPHNTLVKKGIMPLMPAEILTPSTWKEMPSNSYRKRGRPSLKHPPNVPISAPVLPNKNLPVASGSKNYYLTPLFVLDGEKVVPLNASNASNYTVGNYNTQNSQLKSGHTYCKSTTVTKMKHSQMIIDSKTIKQLPTLDLVVSGSSVVSPSVASPKLDLLSTNQSLSVINRKTKESSGSFKVSSAKPNSSNLEPKTKRKRVVSDGAGTRIELYQDVVHFSSSTYSDIESDHLTAPKRSKYQSHPVTKYIYADHGSTKKPEPPTKQKNYSGRDEYSNDCKHHEEASVSSMNPSIECDKPTSPKRRKYQEHHKTNHITLQPSEKFPVSSIGCHEPDPNKLNSPKNVNKQLKGKGGNLNSLSGTIIKTKENMSVSVPNNFENKPSGSPNNENKQLNSKKDSQQNKNKQVKSRKEETVDKQSDNLKKENKQVNSNKMDGRRKVKKRIKSKEEDLEECLDGVPPFITEVFECENIRDGFDNRDLIFVLSLLPDIEEMTSAQRVIFQSRAIQIINDVFANTNPQSVVKKC